MGAKEKQRIDAIRQQNNTLSTPPSGVKRCGHCTAVKPVSEFINNVTKPDGLDKCKACCASYNEKNREQYRKRNNDPSTTVAETKRCCKCLTTKTSKEFYRCASTHDGLNWCCASCAIAAQSITNKKLRLFSGEQLKKEMGGKCVDCGEEDCNVLEYDHVDSDMKLDNVSCMKSIAAIRAEAQKTQLRCRFCHRLKTAAKWTTHYELGLIPAATQREQLQQRNYEHVRAIKRNIGQCLRCHRALKLDDPCQYAAFDFDHRDPKEKVANVSLLCRRRKPIELIDAEIAKCDLLCANCHMRRTREQFGWTIYSVDKEKSTTDEADLFQANLSEDKSDENMSSFPEQARRGLLAARGNAVAGHPNLALPVVQALLQRAGACPSAPMPTDPRPSAEELEDHLLQCHALSF